MELPQNSETDPQQRIKLLELELNKLDEELKKNSEERASLNEIFKAQNEARIRLRQEINELRNTLTSARGRFKVVGEEFNYLKSSVQQFRKELNEKINESRSLRSSIMSLQDELTIDPKIAEKRIDELNWKIQTLSLSVKEEKKLLDQIRYLELQLIKGNKIKSLNEKLTSLKAEIESTKARLDEFQKKIKELANRRREIFAEITKYSTEFKALKSRTAPVYQKWIELKTKLNENHQRYVELTTKRKTTEINIKSLREGIVLINYEKRALDKLREGKRLTLEEYKFLAEKGLLNS